MVTLGSELTGLASQLAALQAKVDAAAEAQQRTTAALGDRVTVLEGTTHGAGGALTREDVLAIIQERLVASARTGGLGCGGKGGGVVSRGLGRP